MSNNRFSEYNSDSINSTPRRAGTVIVPHHIFNMVVNPHNHASSLFHPSLSTNDVFPKRVSIPDFTSFYAPRSFVVSADNNKEFDQFFSTMASHEFNTGDRFIPRRKGVNNDASHYRLMQKADVKDVRYLDVFGEATNEMENWKKKKMNNAFKLLGVFDGLQNNRILNIGTLSTVDFKSLPRERSNDEYGWDCRARKKPLMHVENVDFDEMCYRDLGAQLFRLAVSIRFRNLIDWGAKGYLACGLSNLFCIFSVNKFMTICNTRYFTYLSNVKWSPNGMKVAVSGLDGSTTIFDRTYTCGNHIVWTDQTVDCPCSANREIKCHVICTVWSAKYNYLMTVCDESFLSIRSANDGQLMMAQFFREDVHELSLSPSEKHLVVCEGKIVHIFLFPSLTLAFDINLDVSVKAVAWHPWKSNLLCLGGGPGDGSLYLWNVDSKRQLSSRKVKFPGSVEHLMFNKLSGELLVHWYYVDEQRSRLCSKIVVLSRLDKIVDTIPLEPEHKILNIVWSPGHKKVALQYRDYLVIWNFFGNSFTDVPKKMSSSKPKTNKSDNYLRNHSLETPTTADLHSSFASARRGKNFNYYTIR